MRVHIWKSFQPEFRAESINLSERGVYFESSLPLQVGEIVEILLKMPEEVTGTPTAEWRCSGAVVRVNHAPSTHGSTCAAVEFYCCQVLPRQRPQISPSVMPFRQVSFQMDE